MIETFPLGKERQKKEGTTTTSSWLGTNTAMKNQIISVDILRDKSAFAPLATCLWPPSY
jgi:hypothetical protein